MHLLPQTPQKSLKHKQLNLKKEKLVHSEWEDMSFVDVQNYMETKQVAFTFMDLYSHREISYGIIKNDSTKTYIDTVNFIGPKRMQ